MKHKAFLFISSLLFIAGCSIIGIHLKIHNPHRAGKFPKKTEARSLLGNEDSKYRTCYDVKSYLINISFGNDLGKDHSIRGGVLMTSDATCAFDTMQIDLAENMIIDSVEVNVVESEFSNGKDYPYEKDSLVRKKVDYLRVKGAVFVPMPFKLYKGKSFSTIVTYHGIPSEAKRPPWSGGFVRKEDKFKKPWWGVACEGEGASLWWPCKDVMDDEPDNSVNICLTVPKGLTAVSNGTLLSSFEVSNPRDKGKVCWMWTVSYPINIYNITFYIGNFKLLHDTYYSEVTHDTLQLNHYVLEQNYDKAKIHFQQLKKYLAFYEKTFGPYPWYRDGFKLVESPYAGMEHQSAIAYGNGFNNDPYNGFDYIILHETAHEWWGNSLTAKDLSDVWLHEGFATYAEALYVESTKGHAAYLNYLVQDRLFIINRRPIIGETGLRYFNYRDSDIYMKGTWVLHSLRYVIANDSLFFDIIHSFYMENRMKEIGSDKLEELVNRKTGKDFHWFFETYLHNRFTPELEYCVRGGKLYYRWGKTNSDFRMPAKVTMTGNVPSDEKIIPVSEKVNSISMIGGNTSAIFNTNEFLFKPVENKNLAKEFKKQK